jgi:hypothetical protein
MSDLYTKEQLDYIKKCRETMTAQQIADLFNARFATNKNARAIEGTCMRNGWPASRSYRFKKGDKPWNTGTKGQGLTGVNSGCFKNGSIPPNIRRIESERTCSKTGYRYIKVDEKNAWRLKHTVIWESKNGPVPPGHIVRFIDGDITNLEPDNLEIASRHELLKYNINGLYKAPEELKPLIKIVSKIQVALGEKQRGFQHG